MASSENFHVDDNYLFSLGKKVLNKDKQNVLVDIVKCAVCFEIPKENSNLKIRICKQGHHFCSSCYKQLKHCAICRSELSNGRNFVVEELINKLGPSLGLTKLRLPSPNSAPALAPGLFKCLHQCPIVLHAGQMLPHIRKFHPQNILENVKSNPYTERFDWMCEIQLSASATYHFSLHIFDMGLFTIIVAIKDFYVIGFVHMLAGQVVRSKFNYKLTAKIRKNKCFHEFSASNCEILGYNCDTQSIIESYDILKIPLSYLLNLLKYGDKLQIHVSIYRNNEAVETLEDSKLINIKPEAPIVFNYNRNIRRNRLRNIRKKKLKKKIKGIIEEVNLIKSIETLNLK